MKCPKCGGNMFYDTNRRLVCEKCDRDYVEREAGKRFRIPSVEFHTANDLPREFFKELKDRCENDENILIHVKGQVRAGMSYSALRVMDILNKKMEEGVKLK